MSHAFAVPYFRDADRGDDVMRRLLWCALALLALACDSDLDSKDSTDSAVGSTADGTAPDS